MAQAVAYMAVMKTVLMRLRAPESRAWMPACSLAEGDEGSNAHAITPQKSNDVPMPMP